MQALLERGDEHDPIVSATEREFKDFCYLVAHDLASEFRHVAALSRIMVEELSEGDARVHAELALQSSNRCQSMLNALMVYSSVQTLNLAQRAWHGRSVVERAVVEIGEQKIAKGARIELDVTGEVFADARLLILAIRLALQNSLEAAREGVTPNIAIRGGSRADGVWVLEIVDNGEGLAREFHEKAFAMFWRLNPDPSGIGAGLPTLRRIMRRHGGDAKFLETPQGARLELTMPGAGAQ